MLGAITKAARSVRAPTAAFTLKVSPGRTIVPSIMSAMRWMFFTRS
jgi:hypothetical protein